ncbi:cytochrome c-type biogenesis CcmF C-terminal domain-containing protein, partial [Rhizobium johnstonii]|uniref:cytochrome c-type biogenesis CcmF C-terminal domain-containing protein n=1 Tax=Rhizobium johnstonii TaxID=3019933 RepID=UPI003F99C6B5
QMPTTEAGILTFGLSQLYVSLCDATKDGGIVVRIWWKPFILFIWRGAPTRRRRSLSETRPPKAMNTAPPQMQRMNGC